MSAAPDTPVVFIHIAKTAGTSLTRVLQEHLPADRLAVRTHRPLATLPTADHARTVAVIREPLDRLVSAFAWLGGRPSVLWRGAVGNPDLAAELGLDRFAGPADFLDHFDAFYDDHVRPWADGLAAADRRLGDLMAFGHFNLFVPQHRYLVDARDDLAVGHLLRFEHLADDTAAWLDRVAPGHGPIVWPHLYPSRREPAAALASPRALAAVRDIYAADYALPGMAPSPAPIAAREPSPGLPPLARAVARAAAA
ncbi:sulfotransferase family 2 domain-containing protein, partial [bacterium]|nr:sulfotransferase family 2 domain-containing protein [bacterium]